MPASTDLRRSLPLNDRPSIILNDRVLFRPLTGVGHYVRQLLDALRDEADAIDVHPFLSSIVPARTPRPGLGGTEGDRRRREPLPSPSPSLRGRGVPPPGLSRRLLRALDVPYRVAFRWRARGHDLYHEPNHIPIRCGLPTVTTIHDLSVLAHPEWHPDDRVRWYEREFDAGVRQTSRFIAASEYTKREMIQRLGVAAERIDVTYQAPRPAFTPKDAAAARQARSRFNLPERFFLFVGTLEPRKNVAGLLEAFAGLPQPVRRQVPLVLAGGQGWKMETLHDKLAALAVQDEVRLAGYLTDDALACLYSACTALVWPTLYEGFGLPPLEAMSCGCPVIVSNTTSLPEVVGDAGVLLDPQDVPAWTAAMRRMAEDNEWRDQCRRRGVQRAATFSWQRCARQTIACYQAALNAI